MLKEKEIINLYREREEKYKRLGETIYHRIRSICSEKNIEVVESGFRVKSVDSLKAKIQRKGYKNIEQIVDLVGCRFVVLLLNDAHKLREAILADNDYEIDFDNSIDKTESMGPNELGYLGIHLVVSLKNNEEFKRLKCEIQIRTNLQHVWAHLSNKMLYKKEEDVPKNLRRRFYRLIGLLEIADDEFEKLIKEYNNNQKNIEESIKRGNLALPIDFNSLKAYLELNRAIKNIYIEKLNEWIGDLIAVGIYTIKDFDDVLKKFKEQVYEEYRTNIAKYIESTKAEVSIDEFCGEPGWIIDAIIWHNPILYKEYFNRTGRKKQFSSPIITEQYIEWAIRQKSR